MKRVKILLIGLFFLVIIFLSIRFSLFFISPAEKQGKSRMVVVREGLSLKDVAGELERRKIITSKILFELWAKIMGSTKKIKAGEYQLSPGLPPVRILDILTRGDVITHPVTVPEGFTRKKIAELLDRKGLTNKKDFLSFTNEQSLLKRYGISGPDLEGYLFPDTYQFARGISALTAIDAMVRRFLQVVRPFKGRMDETGMDLKELIILASIVEKETSLASERPMIASVFLNRLKRGMRLESDPTVIYGLKNFNGNLTRKDLDKPTLFNTYIIRGLPPGPIANPGLEAIKAVLYPAKTDYLYFVSKNDGSHYFSKTLSEHNRAVRIYQKKRHNKHRKAS
ncbi:MAG: endolytic transglycosylase MltG [Thermodesulfobacteriota bacterium]|nr:endolytic transglycosylase MltG [Thermodesulfobacteriota bacterium]